MDDAYPHRVSDPAATGLPEYADDDSTAYDDVESPRVADGRDPAALPADRDDGPVAVDEFGTTAEEQLHGEPLDAALSREEPDLSPDTIGDVRDVGPDDEPADEDELILDEEPVDPHLGSVVSVYDRDEPGVTRTDRLGRLVQPDEGAHEDAESDQVGFDAGAAGGGASAEEIAVHPLPDDDLR
jgi:Family of unknown function (DUF5709)